MNRRNASRRGRALLTGLAVATLAVAGASLNGVAVADTQPPSGTPATVSADGLPTWQVNGVVWSSVVVYNTVYVTGSFTKARPPGVAAGGAGEVTANNIFAFDITTGNRATWFSHSLNGQGRAITKSPDNSRVFVGGDFTTADGQTRGHVAAFNTQTGALDSVVKPSVSGGVRAITASASAVYFGGSFSAVSGSSRKNLGAVNTSTGAVLPWAPKADNGAVWSMVLTPNANSVIVGGAFTTLSGSSAYGMGSVSASTGAVQGWEANKTIKDGTSSGAITTLRTDGKLIFGAGYAYGSGSSFEGTFAADPVTGALKLVNDCHGDTYDVLPVGAVLYSVSHAHDCTPVRSFPDTSPRVRWQRALAQTIAPTTTNIGPDSYGWNYNGLPASTILHWFPQLQSGTFTGQSQAAWSLAGNASYVVLAGEFPKVNGVAQQGLTRMAVASLATNKRGPSYTTNPARTTPATTATSPSAGTVKLTFGTAWDYDNASLTYAIRRDGSSTPVATLTVKSNFWTVPDQTWTETGVAKGTHTYQVKITDPYGNSAYSPVSNTVTVS
jgi:hypothetical protein